jgi:hypothetical protein
MCPASAPADGSYHDAEREIVLGGGAVPGVLVTAYLR